MLSRTATEMADIIWSYHITYTKLPSIQQTKNVNLLYPTLRSRLRRKWWQEHWWFCVVFQFL